MQKPLVLIILDGWGLGPPGPGNAISLAQLKNIPEYWSSYPHGELAASGEAVGLPKGEDGNTETGHINIGAGRVVYQDFPRINMSIADGSFYRNEAFLGAIRYATTHKSNLHIMGILSDASVHGSRDHLYALLELMKMQNCACPVYLHLFTDGRDAPPKSSLRFLLDVEAKLAHLGIGKIATIMGRYWAMDRDRRWERTEQAYKALTENIEKRAASSREVISRAYKEGKTDEFIEPTILLDAQGSPLPRIQNHDAVIFYNYRIDRPRQLTRAFVLSDFETYKKEESFDPYAVKYYHKHVVEMEPRGKSFNRKVKLPNIFFVTMTEYERNLPCTVTFPLESIAMPVGRVFSELGLRQLRLSETEKERFVGYYFNGMREDPFAGEDRIIIPSPKVTTYDLIPGMSAEEVTQKLIDRLSLGVYSFIVVNLANPDMVAHTGNIPSAVKACETADTCVGKIVRATLAHDGTCIVTADHGNAEEMLGPNGEVDTEHSTYPVPFIMIDKDLLGNPTMLPSGKLADIAPTVLAWKGLDIPGEMSGNNILESLQRRNG